MELDYLAPFLAQLGDPPTLTKMQATKLKSDCLADLKQRLIDKANLIQVRCPQNKVLLSAALCQNGIEWPGHCDIPCL